MQDIPTINKLRVAKVKCMQSLLFQTRYMFKHKFKRKFVIGDHHIKICEALERVLSGECKRLIINIGPRYGKTELAVKNFMAHGLALNPAAKFIHLSYSDTLALDNSEEVKDLIQEDFYQELFPEVQIKQDSKAKKKWYTTAGGGVYATAAAGQVTGFGAGRVDEEEEFEKDLNEFLDGICQEMAKLDPITKKQKFGGAIIIDDPIKPEDADSDVIREKVNQRFDSTIRNRVNSRNTPIIVIMQRLHPEDLSGYLMREEESDQWEVLSLPSLYVDEAGQLQALWPFKHTVEELQAMQKANELVFDRQYMQNPETKKGKLFPKDELHYFNPATVDVQKLVEFKYGAIDPADEGSDDLSFPIGYLVGNKVYITDVIYNNDGADINEPACVEAICSHKLDFVEIEGNSAWRLFSRSLKKKVQEPPPDGRGYVDCTLRSINNSTNKHSRIWAESAFIKNHLVFRADYREHPQYYKFMKNLFDYNKSQEGTSKNKHDDAPDSLAILAKYFRKNFGQLW